MRQKSVNFFDNRLGLKDKMEKQSSQVKKIKVCILYAIEEENLVRECNIRSHVKGACDALGLFSGTKTIPWQIFLELVFTDFFV